ncbi:MAG TPA: sulfite exporter TauE/SafE family protein [Acidisarcina sp.]|nr:sulfite exporter TauE/SafE family protein [Acidisarcina sp.]
MTLLALLIGVLVGAFSGVVGLGGGILMVPALVYFFHMSQHRAQGTSLAAMLAPVGILAFLEYYKTGNADLKTGLLLAAGFTVGAYFGGASAQHIPELMLRRIFAATLIAVGIRMLFTKTIG